MGCCSVGVNQVSHVADCLHAPYDSMIVTRQVDRDCVARIVLPSGLMSFRANLSNLISAGFTPSLPASQQLASIQHWLIPAVDESGVDRTAFDNRDSVRSLVIDLLPQCVAEDFAGWYVDESHLNPTARSVV